MSSSSNVEPNPNEPIIQSLIDQLSDQINDNNNSSNVISILQQLGDLARDETNRTTMGKMNGLVDTLIRAATSATTDKIQVENKVLRVFANLSFYHKENADFICNESERNFSAIKLCVDHMKLYRVNGDAARLASATLANLCHSENTIRELAAVQYGAVDLALQVLSEFLSSDEVIALDHDEFDIRDDVLRALDNLLESPVVVKMVAETNLVAILTNYLKSKVARSTESYLVLAKLITKVFEALASSEAYRAEAIRLNFIGHLRSVLQYAMTIRVYEEDDEETFEEVNELIEQIVTSVLELLKTEGDFAPQLFEGGNDNMIQQLIRLLARSECSELMLGTVMTTLASIAERDELQRALLDEGILEPIIAISDRVTKQKETVKIHHSTMLKFAIKILSFLSLDNNNLTLLIEKGAGKVFVETLIGLYEIQKTYGPEDVSTFQQLNAFIMRNTCIGLGNLARSDENCLALVEIGASKVLLDFLRNGTDMNQVDMQLICNAAFALTNLTRANSVKELLVAEGAIDVLKEFIKEDVPFAMQFYVIDALSDLAKNHPQHAQLLLDGIDTNTSIVDSALVTMKQLKDQPKLIYVVLKLLLAVSAESDNFHSTIQQKVQSDSEVVTLINELKSNENPKIQEQANAAVQKFSL